MPKIASPGDHLPAAGPQGGPPESGDSPARLYRIKEAMRLLSMSRTLIYEQIRAGRLKTVTQGRARLVPDTAIADYIGLLIREADDRTA